MSEGRAQLERRLQRLAGMLVPWLSRARHPAQFWPQFEALAREILDRADGRNRAYVERRLRWMLAGHRQLLRRWQGEHRGAFRPHR